MVSPLDRRLKDRFRAFLAFQHNEAAAAARQSIKAVLDLILRKQWQAYIVGGTLRDVMLAPSSIFPRDIDVVIAGAPEDDLERTFGDLVSRRTRFDGLHLVKDFGYGGITPSQGQVYFDIWRLEDTWGIRHAGLTPTIANFVRTPFLNIDSVAIELVPKNARRGVTELGFFTALATRTIEVNYVPNPFPAVCIVRSMIMAAKLQFALGSRLAEYIAAYAQSSSLDDLLDAQRSHYGIIRCNKDELRLWLDEITVGVNARASRIELSAPSRRQLALWTNWPPASAPADVLLAG